MRLPRLAKMRREFAVAAALVVMVAAVFWPVGGHEFLGYDDPAAVTGNPVVLNGLTVKGAVWALRTNFNANWHPLTWLSHMLDVQLFGVRPGPHHAVNVVFHALNAVLLFLVLRLSTAAIWRSALVAALFALHPLHVESVAWIAERKDVLAALFWLLAMAAYLWFLRRRGTGRYLALLLCFTLALAAKPMPVTLPFLLLLWDWWPLGRLHGSSRTSLSHALLEKIPLLALAAASSVVTFLAQSAGGAVAPLQKIPFLLRLTNAVTSYGAYIGKMILPVGLAVIYPFPLHGLPPWRWATTGALILLVSAALTLLMRRLPWAATGWFWYLGTLVPVIGLIQVGDQAMADRYTYMPLTGLFILAVWGAGKLAGRLGRKERSAAAAAGIILVVLGAMARRQAGFWRDNVTLFEHTVAVTRDNWTALGILGIALAEKGELERAIACYEEALRIRPDYLVARYGLGNALQEVGKLDAAASQYRAALLLSPRHLGALNNLGTTLYRQRKLREAEEALRRALDVDPGLSEAHVNLGNALAEMGRIAEAAGHFREALRLDPALQAHRREMEAALRRHGGSGVNLSP